VQPWACTASACLPFPWRVACLEAAVEDSAAAAAASAVVAVADAVAVVAVAEIQLLLSAQLPCDQACLELREVQVPCSLQLAWPASLALEPPPPELVAVLMKMEAHIHLT